MIESSSILRLRPDVRYRIIDGEGVMVRQEAGEMVVLNETGSRILDFVDGTRAVASIIAAMAAEYAVDRKDLERDVPAFLAELCAIGAAELQESPGGQDRQ